MNNSNKIEQDVLAIGIYDLKINGEKKVKQREHLSMACVGRDKDKKWQLAFLGRQIQKLEKRISHCQSPTLINPN